MPKDNKSKFYYEQINDYDNSYSRATWWFDPPNDPSRIDVFSDSMHIHDRNNRCVVMEGDQLDDLIRSLCEVREWSARNFSERDKEKA